LTISYGQKIGTAEEPVLHQAIKLAESPELERRVAKRVGIEIERASL
jgi:hypothetical protein